MNQSRMTSLARLADLRERKMLARLQRVQVKIQRLKAELRSLTGLPDVAQQDIAATKAFDHWLYRRALRKADIAGKIAGLAPELARARADAQQAVGTHHIISQMIENERQHTARRTTRRAEVSQTS